MNDQTEKLLRELADKLGTTVEHLWGVLIHQSAISGVVNLIVIAAWCALLVLAYRIVKRNTAVPPASDNDKYPRPKWGEEGGSIAWFLWSLFLTGTVLIVGCCAETIAASLLNPEYWALKELIGAR